MAKNEIAGGRGHYYWKQSAFSAGEFSPEVSCRDDVDRYAYGVKEMTNFIPSPFGGVRRRAGMRFINEAGNMSQKVRLVPFIYNEDISFILEFGHQYIRVYRNDGLIFNGGSPVQITTPYSASDIFNLKFTQSADTMYICHKNYPVKTLFRNSDTNWTLSNFQPIEGPFTSDNTTDVTLTPSGISGNITINSSSNVFSSGMVGGLLRISQEVLGQTVSWDTNNHNNSHSGTIKCNGDWTMIVGDTWDGSLRVQQSNDNGATWLTIATYNVWSGGSAITDSGNTGHFCLLRLYGSAWEEGGNATLTATSFVQDGYVKITGYNSPTQVTGTVQVDRNNYIYSLGGTAATRLWAIGSWNNDYGYPSVSAFYQDRLCFASTKYEPLGFWASCTGDYNRFRVQSEVQDDDAISVQLVSGKANDVLNMVSANALLCFTYGSEWRISSGTSRSSISPTSIDARQQSAEGSNNVTPLIINDRMLFVTRLGDTVRDFAYDYSYDSYKGTDQTLYARHLFKGHKIVDWAYQKSPYEVIWCVRDDGILLSFTYVFDEKVYAWAKHETDGYVESVASIPGDDKDELFLVVRRYINGQTVRYIERLEETRISSVDEDLEQYTLLDSHLTMYNSVSVSGVTTNRTKVRVTTSSAHGCSTGDIVHTRAGYKGRFDGCRFTVTKISDKVLDLEDSEEWIPYISDGISTIGRVVHTLSGLSHLNGRTVRVLGDGSDLGHYTVSNGQITISRGVCECCIGLNYESRLQTLDIQIPMQDGNSRGRKKRIVKPKIELYLSWGGEIGINGYDNMANIPSYPNGVIQYDLVGKSPDAYTGVREVEPLSTVCDNCSVCVRQEQPYPLNILNIMAEVVVS